MLILKKEKKVDLNKVLKGNENKSDDGYRVRIFSKTSKREFKAKAWEIDDEGIVTLKSANSHTMYLGKYKYDFDKKSFQNIEGFGPRFFIPAE